MAKTALLVYMLLMSIDLFHSRGLRCYTCFNAVDLDTCQAVSQCNREKEYELCGAKRYVDRLGRWIHDMGCIPKQLCPNNDISRIGPVGRRRRRQVPGVFRCCDTDYCKVGQFKLEQTTHEQSTQTVHQTIHEQDLATQTVHQTSASSCDQAQDLEHCTIWGNTLNIDICKTDEVANQLCRHYCGRCADEITTSSFLKTCKDHDVCSSLRKTSFDICKDDRTAVHICPQSCQRCNDVISGTTKMASDTTSISSCQDNPLCTPLMLQFNISELCSDDFMAGHICKQTCNACGGSETLTIPTTTNSKFTTTSPMTTVHISAANTKSGAATMALYTTENGGKHVSNSTRGVSANSTTTPKNIYQSTAAATKQCVDLDPNCPYLESTISICNTTSVAMAIGCDLTCGYCKNTDLFLALCEDLDGQSSYCKQEHREVICHDKEEVLRSKCFKTCGRCDLFCTANPLLCKYPTTTPLSGDKSCTDLDKLNYCKQINVDVDCYDELHINSSGCFSTCHRCDLHPYANITLPTPTGTVTIQPITRNTRLETTLSVGDESCKDTGQYCTLISKYVICHYESYITTYGCFSTCSRCDLSPTFSTIPSLSETTADNYDLTTTEKTTDVITDDMTTEQMSNEQTKEATEQEMQTTQMSTMTELTTTAWTHETSEQISTVHDVKTELSRQQTTEQMTTEHTNEPMTDEQSTKPITPEQMGEQRTEEMTTADDISTDVTKRQTTGDMTTTIEQTPEITTEQMVTITIEKTTEIGHTTEQQTTEATTEILTTGHTTEETTEATTEVLTTGHTTEQTTEATTEVLTTGHTTQQTTEATTEVLTTGHTTDQITEATTIVLTTTIDPYAACKAPITKDNEEFFLLYDRGPLPMANPELKLFVSSPAVKWIVLFNPELGICLNMSVNATTKGIIVPSAFLVNGNILENKGIYTITSAKTSMTAFYKDPLGYEAFSVLPKASLSTQYVVASYPTNMGNTFIGITATKPNTTVTVDLKISGGDRITYNNVEYKNGQTIILHLNRSGTVEIGGTGDLTGSRIVSNNEIAVQSGSGCAKVPEGSSLCNYLIEMMPPFENLGTFFFAPPIYQNKTFIVRVISPKAHTNVQIVNSKYNKTYVLSKSGDFLTLNSSSPMIITSDKSVMTVYYQTGLSQPPVPFMSVIPPTDKFKTFHEFIIPDDGLKHHILITSKSREYPFLTLDNNPLIFKNPYVIDSTGLNNTFLTARSDIRPGHHTMGSMTGNVKFGLIVNANGDAANNVAYGYPA